MNRRVTDALTFGGAAAAVGVSALVLKAVCPGGCVGCASCVAGIVPAAGAGIAIAGTVAGTYLSRRHEARYTHATPREDTT